MNRFLVRTALLPTLAAGNRDDAIREMVASLAASGAVEASNADDIVAAIFRREQLGTTGIGNGLAIPHSRHPSVDRLVGTLAVVRHPAGVDFSSHDGEPVYAIVLIVSPQDQPGPHLRALDSVVTAFRDDTLLPRLRACQTADELWAVLSNR
ncbi:MAG: PTS sugar transporter subunit IIA [Fimbriiglobus sp.]|nr:PTS sugar transporter subunit IIA [Fimbriiglobus sp.]